MGVSTEAILSGLCNYKPVGMRQNIYNIGDVTVIEDCYNASPESMHAAIGVLRDLYRGRGIGRMTALLGDMYELGTSSERFHEEVGKEFADNGGDLLFTFGSSADGIANGAVFGGMVNEKIFRNNDIKNPALSGEMLLHSLKAGDVLLVKASRGAALERVLSYLKQNSDRLCRA
jgi:UDP-N-acetylmuramoyl-tripeptide--D-alanyl-D-alanine ligase